MDDEHGAAAEPEAPEPSSADAAAAAAGATEARVASREAQTVFLVEEAALGEARIAALHARHLSVLADLQVDPSVDSRDCRTCNPSPPGRILPGGKPDPVRDALLQDLLDGILPPPVDPDADPPS